MPVQLRSHPKASVSLLPFSSRSSNNMVLSARKRKVNVWASKHTSVAPLPCFQPLDCELKWFFSFFFHPAWRGGTGDVEWWTGVQALCCSALHWRRSLICIIVPHIKHNPPRTPSHPPPLPIHILLFHPYDCAASHMAAHTPAPNQGVNVYLSSCLL